MLRYFSADLATAVSELDTMILDRYGHGLAITYDIRTTPRTPMKGVFRIMGYEPHHLGPLFMWYDWFERSHPTFPLLIRDYSRN